MSFRWIVGGLYYWELNMLIAVHAKVVYNFVPKLPISLLSE